MNLNSTSFFRKLVVFLIFGATGTVSAQLTGVKTIPGDYVDFTSAINDLNTVGVGPGGVTFDVAAGYTETSVLPTITASGIAGSPIIFQKAGTGSNPVIFSGGGAGTLDGIIRLEGADFITFNGIDVTDSPSNTTTAAQAEWGYALLKADATNGCQNVTITNCNITMTRTNTSSVGIYAANHTPLATTSLTVSAVSGSNSYNQFTNNIITNGYVGIRVAGYASATPYTYYDQENKIGGSVGNSITNFGGGTSTAYGVYGIYQNKLEVGNNTLTGGSSSHTTTLYGIFLSTGTNSNVDIYFNNVTLSTGSTSSTTYAINNAMGSTGTNNQVNIYNNTVKSLSWPTATSGAFYAVYSTSSCYNINMYNNSVNTNAKGGTGAFYAVYNSGSVVNKALMYSNTVFDNAITSTGTFYGIYSNPGTSTNSDVYDNQVYNNTNGGTFYGVYSTTGNVTNLTTNQIYGNSTTGTTITGVYVSTGTSVNIFKNKIYDQSTSGASGVANGIQTNGGTTHNISNNLIGNLKAPASSSLNAVIGIHMSSGTTTNVYYNTIYLNAGSTGANFGTSGLYATATPTVDIRNNIVVNTSTANGTGITAAHRRGTTILTDFATTSNNNLYYAGTPSASNVIFYDGTNADLSIADYKARVTPAETLSISENPPFLSTSGSATDFLHINGTISTGIESGAAQITGFNDDFDAVGVRAGYPLAAQVNGGGIAPDIGADEGDFTPISLDMGVNLLVSPVGGVCHPGPDSVIVRIKNFSGIAIDFSVNPVTVNASVSGVSPMTFTPVVINTGTLAGGATMNVNVSNSYNMSAAGTYSFDASIALTGDGNATNNVLTTVEIEVSGGVATASFASICSGAASTLTVSGNSGPIQWQSYDATTSTWVNETGTGNTSTTYTVSPLDTTIYRALTCGVHASVADTINVITVNTPLTTGANRCGPGTVTLTASGAPQLNWYTSSTGGIPVYTGASYEPTLSATDTFYVEGFIPSGGNLLKITEADLGTNDALEIQNLSTGVLNTAGWVVAASNSYSNINSVNTMLWNLPATMQPGETLMKSDQSSSPYYWGNNLLWNPGNFPGFAGWIIILDNTGAIVDFTVWGWQASDIQGMSTTINGFPITIGSNWSGNGILAVGATTGLSISRQGMIDTETSADFSIITSSVGTQNPGLSNPWGCSSSARTQVIGTVNPVPDATISTVDISCFGLANGEASVTIASGTSPYTYSWNTGSTTASVNLLSAGTYTAVVTDAAGCTDTVMSVINEPAVLASTVTATDVCGTETNGTATAATTGGTGLYAYDWNVVPSQTTATATNLSAGTYTLTVTDQNGCTENVSVVINSLTVPVVSTLPDTTICEGTSLTMTATGADNYSWNNAAGLGATVTVSPTSNTTYIVIGTSNNGCSSTDTVDVTIDPLPIASFSTSGSPTVSFVSTSANATSYSWDFGDGSPVETTANPTHAYLADGTYNVTLIATNGCSSDTTTASVVVIGTGINGNESAALTVSPNPSQGSFMIAFSNESSKEVTIRITDAQGKLVYHENVSNTSMIRRAVDLSSEAKGVYFLQVTDAQNVITKQLVIN